MSNHDLMVEVIDAYKSGVRIRDIARNLNIPINWIFHYVDSYEQDQAKKEPSNEHE